jgi:transcriptional regulator with XRE-family HTH domain
MAKENDMHLLVAKNIKKRRQKLGLSQESLADHCGLHRTYIGAVERGERNITINTLYKIARALNCPPVDLLSDTKVMQ